ncbi:MAG TPA: ATPase domain-containing protein [Micropepsaceae bacterium]|nr:ATPase domain-containing protein [Micropepsaceae bacterium]
MAKKRNGARGHGAAKPASRPKKVAIRKLATGIPGLDGILNGGLPEFSFNIIAGGPGSGKTTMAHQFVFANATAQRPALYFTVLGESPIKMLRYQQQYGFFDPAKLNGAIRFINLSETVLNKDLGEVLNEIVRHVEAAHPAIVVVDSFRTALRKRSELTEMDVQFFVQQLALHLTAWEATTFLIGEYADAEVHENPVFTVADGVFWLSQMTERNSVVRKLQVVKMRGVASVPGLHTFRITEDGLQTFSRTLGLEQRKGRPDRRPRLSLGIPDLDKMMSGGIPLGDSLLLAGASGTGKSAFGTHFIAEGLKHGEPGIMAVFEERPEDCMRRAKHLGQNLEPAVRDGKLKLLYLRPLDLSIDESLQAILDAVTETGAKRLVIDSLVGFEMALAPGFRTDFRESLYRMMASLTNTGVTVLSTVELDESFTEFRFSHYMVSFLADDIIRLRYVDLDGVLRRILTVVKMRDSAHSKDICEYEITRKGVSLTGNRLNQYRALITGIPAYWKDRRAGETE